MTEKYKPTLDPAPTGKPHDWQYSKIQEVKAAEIVRPAEWKNPYARLTAPRDQKDRGTCVGQSSAHCYDMRYIELTGDIPTDSDKSQFKKDVIDSIGTLHDILYPQSASAEAFYQISRKIGNVTYPSGSEIRFAARAWINYGMNLESQWHTDKNGNMVWMENAGYPVATPDGGVSQTDAATFASNHKAEGWAVVGDENANATWDGLCDAIYDKKFVLGGIPIYANYTVVAGTSGSLPDPSGSIVGYHALCFYGYDTDTLYFLHSWGDWCGRYGSISRNYFNNSRYESIYIVILDSKDVKIARDVYKSLTVSCIEKGTGLPLSSTLSVNGVQIGTAPQKFAVESGKSYTIDAAMTGYNPASVSLTYIDQTELVIEMEKETTPPLPHKNWLELLIDWILSFFRK